MINRISKTIILSSLLSLLCSCGAPRVDVLIIGGSASGTAAGVEAARSGAKTLLLEEHTWLGGMLTAAGVSAVDGNYKLRGGFFGEFCDSIAARYGGYDSLITGWVSNVLYEPSVGNDVLKSIVAKENNLTVSYNTTVEKIERLASGEWRVTATAEGKPKVIEARILIDGTELGDVAKMCGVGYDIGMDARHESQEEIAPEQANDIVQDLTYVAILKDYGPGSDRTIERPAGYDPSSFYCACQVPKCTQPKENQRVWDCPTMLTYGKLPNNKYMINWPIEGNDFYLNIIDMTPAERQEALTRAKAFTLSFIYYLQTELGYTNLALADDEFPTPDKLPIIPYHRESRRIHGEVRFTVNHVAKPYEQAEPLYRTGIGVGDYPIDHHHARYPDWDKLPDLHFYRVPSYNVPLGCLIPKGVDGLIVAEKSISVSNLLNGSTRLQPVVLQIGQAAGALAALAIRQKKDVREVSVRDVQDLLLQHGAYIMPYLDLPKTHTHFKAIQRIGATGLLKGKGMNVGWSNQTWFFTESLLRSDEMMEGIASLYKERMPIVTKGEVVTVEEAMSIINTVANATAASLLASEELWRELELPSFDASRPITRGEFAVLFDATVNPFSRIDIDIKGNIK